jgi:putative ABC transport system ATP-binding protein
MSAISTVQIDEPGLRARPAVIAHDVKKRYGAGPTAVDALRGVTVGLHPGEVVAIMGPSGSGKTTLMHVMAGLDTPDAGVVTIDGQDLGKLDDRRLTRLRRDRVGFVFQAFNLLPTLSVEENVALPLRLARRRRDRARVRGMLDRVGLLDRAHHRPSELSGGQQQRVAVARALITRPAVVFADEPTGNLDSRASAEVLDLLREAAHELDQAIAMVTHDARAAATADRVLFLADGRLVAERGRTTADDILDAMKEIS